jgi:Flp pilus assembly protein TadG
MAKLINKLGKLFRRQDGTQMIEFAIVFPVLLLLFAGTAELGRLFYRYTSLAKATRGSARYLSRAKETNWGVAPCTLPEGVLQISCTTAGQNMLMCGNPGGCGGPGQPAVIDPHLQASNIVITKTNNTPGPNYLTVAITNYTYQPLVFNLNAMTGGNFNLTLTPSTTMRYLRN